MSRTDANELERDVVRNKKEKYDNLREQYENDEISESEYDRQVSEMMKSGVDFLDYEETATDSVKDTGRSLKRKLAYYSLPITVLGFFAAVILIPGINPMMAVVAAPTILTLAVLTWGYFKLRSILK